MIRDYSWLKFPTLRVFVPELYIGFGEYYHFKPNGFEGFKRKILHNINDITLKDIDILKTPEFLIYLSFNSTLDEFFGIKTTTLERVSAWEFFGLLATRLNRNKIAKLYWKHILSHNLIDYTRYKDFLAKKENILPYLSELLPNCLNSCEKCSFQTECKYYIQKEFEEQLVPKTTHLFVKEGLAEN